MKFIVFMVALAIIQTGNACEQYSNCKYCVLNSCKFTLFTNKTSVCGKKAIVGANVIGTAKLEKHCGSLAIILAGWKVKSTTETPHSYRSPLLLPLLPERKTTMIVSSSTPPTTTQLPTTYSSSTTIAATTTPSIPITKRLLTAPPTFATTSATSRKPPKVTPVSSTPPPTPKTTLATTLPTTSPSGSTLMHSTSASTTTPVPNISTQSSFSPAKSPTSVIVPIINKVNKGQSWKVEKRKKIMPAVPKPKKGFPNTTMPERPCSPTFSNQDMFLRISTKECDEGDLMPIEELYLRTLCSLDYIANKVSLDQYSDLDRAFFMLNPARANAFLCSRLAFRKKYCIKMKRPRFPNFLKRENRRRQTLLFLNMNAEHNCTNVKKETPQELLARQVCRARLFIYVLPTSAFSVTDYAFSMLSPSFGNENRCDALFYRREKCK